MKEQLNENEKLVLNNSMERAEELHKKSVISASTMEELNETYDFLTYLRIKSQALSISRNEAPGNTIALGQLSHIEALTLKKINTDISSLQSLLGSVYSRRNKRLLKYSVYTQFKIIERILGQDPLIIFQGIDF